MRINASLEDVFLEKGIVNQEQLNEANTLKRQKKISIQEAIVELGFSTENELIHIVSKQLNIPIKYEMELLDINSQIIHTIPETLAREHDFFPFELRDRKVLMLVKDPLNLRLEDEIRNKFGYDCEFYLGFSHEIHKLIDKHYVQAKIMQEIESMNSLNEEDEDYFDININDENSPIVKIVNSIFMGAVQEGASDIHIGPTEKKTEVRYRVDGILHLVRELPKKTHQALVSRIKTMGDMDIAEKRTSQDGRIQINLDGNPIDMRVSTLPSVTGEKVTIRLLDKGNLLMQLSELGFSEHNFDRFSELLEKPVGIVLITGPTGSGKSSSLYTAINELNDVTKNIVTIEDPVEYRLDGIVQVQVNPKAGLTFASGLRSILRQDPDIILIGEIRDNETAQIAVKASNTGHLVFATLHTNDAISSIMRLIDMDIEPYLVAGTVQGVSNQRLIRRICSNCKVEYKSTETNAERIFFGIEEGKELTLYKGDGCEVCKGTGYKGRLPIHELLILNNEIRRLIVTGATEQEIRDAAIEAGMKTLKMDGLEKALLGLTTLTEVKKFVVET